LLNSYLTGSTFYQHGDGGASRSFCYVDDLVRGIIAIAGNDASTGEVINLGNPEEYTIQETIGVIEELTDSKINIEVIDPMPDDPKRRRPDITKATNLLNWSPKTSLSEGLKLMVNSYEKSRL